MLECNHKRWTEKGGKIICRYKANDLVGVSDKKLALTIVVDSFRNSQSGGTVTIRDLKSDRIVAQVKGLRKGASKAIPLDLNVANQVELSIACSSGDGLRIASFATLAIGTEEKIIPHILLDVQ